MNGNNSSTLKRNTDGKFKLFGSRSFLINIDYARLTEDK
jgi:hypothetical protein